MKTIYIFLLAAVFFAATPTQAQQEKWEGGFFIGAANSMGDLIESDILEFNQTNLAFGFLVKRSLSETLGLRLGLTRGKISGNDTDNDGPLLKERGFTFENNITELAVTLQYEPLGGRRYSGGNFHQIFSPYFFAGIGLGFSNPTTTYNGSNSPRVQEDMAFDAQKALFTTPVGLGFRYDLTKKWNLGLEVSLHPTFDDYLDGVSLSGNPDNNDWYTFGGITLTTRFGNVDSDGDGIADDSDDCPNIAGLTSTKGCPDADLDGIEDARDACPEIAGDSKFNGCPDTDEDGVADNQDDCPTVPGLRRFRGCADSDGDGVPDPRDICPNLAGVSSLDGCPDKDSDGITDADDACPELAGIAGMNGCPDSDSDGIIDPDDKCPNSAGSKEFSGCPDSDGDGIGDGDDACPSNAGPATNDGCPEIKESDLATLELAMQNVRFKTSSDELLSQSNTVLNEVAEVLKRYPNYDLKISGYTDNVGNDSSNQTLSQQRALACYQYLLTKNIDRKRMSYAGYGETNPLASNDSVQGRARNRRVEFELILRQ